MSFLSLFGCGRKKQKADNLQGWLDTHWSGKFEVISTPTNITDKDYYFNKRNSVVAEKTDTEVQFLLSWIKGEEDLGLTQEMVEEAFSKSRERVLQARTLLLALKDAKIENVSVGIESGYAHVFVFAEPTPAAREELLRKIVDVTSSNQANETLDYDICFMEPNTFGAEFKEIIPAGHWARRGSWQQTNETMRLQIPAGSEINQDTLENQWQFNPQSEKMLSCIEDAYAQTLKWSVKNMPRNITIESQQMVGYALDEDNGLLVTIDFPYFEAKADSDSNNASGMISGIYHVDNKTFTHIHVMRDEDAE